MESFGKLAHVHVWESWQQRLHSGFHDPSEEHVVKVVLALSTLHNVCSQLTKHRCRKWGAVGTATTYGHSD